MFSLGVVVFEMCHAPFQTGMERLLTLRKLREKAELPAEFASGRSSLRQIVQWLIDPDPDKRPSAMQLLSSPLLPPRADTDSSYLKEITTALWKPNSSAAGEILSVLFDQPPGTTKSSPPDEQSLSLSLSFDIDVLENYSRLLIPRSMLTPSEGEGTNKHHAETRDVSTLRYLAAVRGIAKKTFRQHGAVEFRPKLLELRSADSMRRGSWNPLLTVDEMKQLQYMDCTGKIVHLETNLISQFAKLAAFAQVQRFQRFAIDGVYVPRRSDGVFGEGHGATGHPSVAEEAAFDTVLLCTDDGSTSLLFADVEAVTAAIEFISELQVFLPDCVLRLNDPRLLDSIIELCGWQESRTGTRNHRSSTEKKFSISSKEKESLLRLLSLAADGVLSPSEMSAVMRETTAVWNAKPFLKRITPFLSVLCLPPADCTNRNPTQLLDALEKVGYCVRQNVRIVVEAAYYCMLLCIISLSSYDYIIIIM